VSKNSPEVIDKNFRFTTVDRDGNVYTEENAFIICADDAAAIAALKEYKRACKTLGSNQAHLENISSMIERVIEYQIDKANHIVDA